MLILTCTGVSFAHGSNDGQKGMGLIMLILVGTVPTAYALNRAMPDEPDDAVRRDSRSCAARSSKPRPPATTSPGDPRPALSDYVRTSARSRRDTCRRWPPSSAASASRSRSTARWPRCRPMPSPTSRNDMYLASEAIRFLMKDAESDLDADDACNLDGFKELDRRGDQVHSDSGSRWRSRSRSAWARWSAGSASSSRSARRSARRI